LVQSYKPVILTSYKPGFNVVWDCTTGKKCGITSVLFLSKGPSETMQTYHQFFRIVILLLFTVLRVKLAAASQASASYRIFWKK
jgi:hypothetical protein